MKDLFTTNNQLSVRDQFKPTWQIEEISSPTAVQVNHQEGYLATSPVVIVPLVCLSPIPILIVLIAIKSAYQKYRLDQNISRLQQIIRLEKLLQLTPNKH